MSNLFIKILDNCHYYINSKYAKCYPIKRNILNRNVHTIILSLTPYCDNSSHAFSAIHNSGITYQRNSSSPSIRSNNPITAIIPIIISIAIFYIITN